jgi:hypothetical protein
MGGGLVGGGWRADVAKNSHGALSNASIVDLEAATPPQGGEAKDCTGPHHAS